jgi:hypothetical protein
LSATGSAASSRTKFSGGPRVLQIMAFMELPLQIEGGFNHEKPITSNPVYPSRLDKTL